MFAKFDQRPATTQAIRVTTRNYAAVADYIRNHIADDRGVDVTAPTAQRGHRASMSFRARVTVSHAARVYVPIPGYLMVFDHDGAPYYQGTDADMFTAQYAPAPAPATHVGTDPDYADTPRATAAVAALDAASAPLARLFGPHSTTHPDDYVRTHGLLVRPLVGGRIRVDHTRPDAPNTPGQLALAATVLADAGFTVRDDTTGYLIATPPATT